jgi:hypothetical protein
MHHFDRKMLLGLPDSAGRRHEKRRKALLRDGVETLLSGDVDTGKAILRDYIKATVGFEKLGEATGTQAKSLNQ